MLETKRRRKGRKEGDRDERRTDGEEKRGK